MIDSNIVYKRKCKGIAIKIEKFESSSDDPDEGCIDCILDDILDTPEGEFRNAWIGLFKQGLMGLNCARTGKSYTISKEFFDKIFKYE